MIICHLWGKVDTALQAAGTKSCDSCHNGAANPSPLCDTLPRKAIVHGSDSRRFIYLAHEDSSTWLTGRRIAKESAGDLQGALTDAKEALKLCPDTEQGRRVAAAEQNFLDSQGQRESHQLSMRDAGEYPLARALSRQRSQPRAEMLDGSDDEYDGESD